MEVIDVEFMPMHEISVGECLGMTGVYVLWSMNARERPSYIGEGDVLSRILSHYTDKEKPFASGLDGYVGALDGHTNRLKTDAQIVEKTLLEAADRLGISPRINKASGNRAAIDRRGKRDDTIRVNVRGWHPLRLDKRISGTARLTWRWYDEWVLDEMPWHRSG